jgi:hypothetical protein
MGQVGKDSGLNREWTETMKYAASKKSNKKMNLYGCRKYQKGDKNADPNSTAFVANENGRKAVANFSFVATRSVPIGQPYRENDNRQSEQKPEQRHLLKRKASYYWQVRYQDPWIAIKS